MYIHLGGDVLIKKNKIVAIIDLKNLKKSQINEKFLCSINKNKNIIRISENGKDITLIITVKEHYLSPISSTTLLKRSFFNMGDLCDTALGHTTQSKLTVQAPIFGERGTSFGDSILLKNRLRR